MAIRSLPEYESNEDYVHIKDVARFVEWMTGLNVRSIAVDTETHFVEGNGISKFIKGAANNTPFGVSIFFDSMDGTSCGYWIDSDLHLLAPLFEAEYIDKIFHNAKYDLFMLKNIGLEVRGDIHDTMVLMQLIDEEHECKTPDGGKKKTKALKHLAYHFLGEDAHELEDLVKEYRKIIAANKGISTEDVSYKDVNDENPQLMMDYAVKDTEYTFRLFTILYPMMLEQDLTIAYETDIRATIAVMEIERNGFAVDIELMQDDERRLDIIREGAIAQCYGVAGYQFNIDSDRDLVKAFESLGVEWKWFTETGEYATDKKVLKHLMSFEFEQDVFALAEQVSRYRKASKILSTYITGIYPYIQNGRVHCDYHISPNDYNQGGTKTGRLSSSNPNLQNIPKKPVELCGSTFNVRNYFVADPDYILVFNDFDYLTSWLK